MTVSDIAALLGLPFEGEGARDITGFAPLDTAETHHLSFAASRKARREAQSSTAGCLIVPPDFDNAGARAIIRAKDPRGAFAKVVWHLHPPAATQPGINPTAIIVHACTIAPDAATGTTVVCVTDASVKAVNRS